MCGCVKSEAMWCFIHVAVPAPPNLHMMSMLILCSNLSLLTNHMIASFKYKVNHD